MNLSPWSGLVLRALNWSLVRASASALFVTSAFAQMSLISETRSVSVNYYGTGAETHTSSGTFGVFEASAVGIPFGGGFVSAYQKSNITSSDVSIVHQLVDNYGPGGNGRSDFELRFSLLQDTEITIDGYCNYFSGFVSLTSVSFGAIPLVWGGPGFYHNYLNFDQVLGAGEYILTSYELPREAVTTTITLHAASISVPDDGITGVWFAVALLGLFTGKRRAFSGIRKRA